MFEGLKSAVQTMTSNIKQKGMTLRDKADAKIEEIGKAFEKCMKS